jgi:hypothetical protein
VTQIWETQGTLRVTWRCRKDNRPPIERNPMVDTKQRFPRQTADQADALQKAAERRRLSRIVHDHKGTATVQWHDAPEDYKRQVFEIEDTQPAAATAKRGLNTGSLAIESQDSHNPYTRVPETDRKRAPGQRRDLRKLSAWIKMMRALEEAKKNKDEDD